MKTQKLQLIKKGKNCDIYENPNFSELLFFHRTNRVSVGDVLLPVEVPYKGLIQNYMSIKWMEYLQKKTNIPNHLVSKKAKDLIKFGANDSMAGSLIAAEKMYPIPIECIVRGYYIPESKSWNPYKETGEMYGNVLPAGLKESEKLPEPIYTPSTKAELGMHDENISYAETIHVIEKWLKETFSLDNASLANNIAMLLEKWSIRLYEVAHQYALQAGIILADTKLEFGLNFDSEGYYHIKLIDEVFTPDSSRFWDASVYEVGKPQPSMDKQFLRRIVYNDLKWDGHSEIPELPVHSVYALSEIYQNIFERLFAEKVVNLSEAITWEWKEAKEEIAEEYSAEMYHQYVSEYEASLAEEDEYPYGEDE